MREHEQFPGGFTRGVDVEGSARPIVGILLPAEFMAGLREQQIILRPRCGIFHLVPGSQPGGENQKSQQRCQGGAARLCGQILPFQGGEPTRQQGEQRHEWYAEASADVGQKQCGGVSEDTPGDDPDKGAAPPQHETSHPQCQNDTPIKGIPAQPGAQLLVHTVGLVVVLLVRVNEKIPLPGQLLYPAGGITQDALAGPVSPVAIRFRRVFPCVQTGFQAITYFRLAPGRIQKCIRPG